MATAQDIKRRIKSVKNTHQITKAMKMVSAAKLRRTQDSLLAMRPYADRLEEMVAHLHQGEHHHPYLEERNAERICYLIFTADRGLCGGYNGNLIRYADEVLANCEVPYSVIPMGSHAQEHFQGEHLIQGLDLPELGDIPQYDQGVALAGILSNLYLSGEYDEIHLIYTEFQSAMAQRPATRRLLPVPEVEESEDHTDLGDYIFEPGEQEILNSLLPLYLEVCVARSLLEVKASEHGARMTAMSAASDNALEMIDQLTLSLNRARQAAITTEITEIVGGAAALGSFGA